jgi:hypothetical protein
MKPLMKIKREGKKKQKKEACTQLNSPRPSKEKKIKEDKRAKYIYITQPDPTSHFFFKTWNINLLNIKKRPLLSHLLIISTHNVELNCSFFASFKLGSASKF